MLCYALVAFVLMHFYPRDAMLARVIAIATCLSVRPLRAGIVSKRRKLAA